MAKKMEKKNDLVPIKTSPIRTTININRVCSSAITSHTFTTEDVHDILSNREDIESIKGRFAWNSIGGYNVPYIIRMINGKNLHYISVRIVESQILSNYLRYLHPNIYSCTSIKSDFILESEAKLLNDINIKHSDTLYGKEQFRVNKDCIVLMEDVQEFYAFLEVCYKKLLCTTPGYNEKCGYIRINSKAVIPYCIIDNQKYVPLFYFEGHTDKLKNRSLEIKNWNLAYLKFCFKVQGINIRNELYDCDSCIAVKLDHIKDYFPSESNFEEYWPAQVVNTELLINQKPAQANPPGVWIKPPQTVMEIFPEQEITSIHSFPTSAPVAVPPPNMILPKNNMNHNGCFANQMVNSYSDSVQEPTTQLYPSTSKNVNVVAQHFNSSSTGIQQSSMNNIGHIAGPPSSILRVGTTAPIVNVISSQLGQQKLKQQQQHQQQRQQQQQRQLQHQRQLQEQQQQRQLRQQQQQRQLQQQQQQQLQMQRQQEQQRQLQMQRQRQLQHQRELQEQHQQRQLQHQRQLQEQQRQLQLQEQHRQRQLQLQEQQQQQQQLRQRQHHQIQQYKMITHQVQQTNEGLTMNVTNTQITNIQQRNASRSMPITTSSASEIIDLSTPPSSPNSSQTLQDTVHSVRELKRVHEMQLKDNAQINSPYKIQITTIDEKMIFCINAKPYMYSDQMVFLDDLIMIILPSCSIPRCAHILQKYLQTTLYRANTDQINLLRNNRRHRNLQPELSGHNILLITLQDTKRVLLQLKNLVSKSDEQIQQYQENAKRQCMS